MDERAIDMVRRLRQTNERVVELNEKVRAVMETAARSRITMTRQEAIRLIRRYWG